MQEPTAPGPGSFSRHAVTSDTLGNQTVEGPDNQWVKTNGLTLVVPGARGPEERVLIRSLPRDPPAAAALVELVRIALALQSQVAPSAVRAADLGGRLTTEARRPPTIASALDVPSTLTHRQIQDLHGALKAEPSKASQVLRTLDYTQRHLYTEDGRTLLDPQEAQDNAFATVLRAISDGPHVTPQSRARRQALHDIGPELELFAQRELADPLVRLALVPRASTLKGYAGDRSDVEFDVAITSSGDPDVLERDEDLEEGPSSKLFREADRLLRLRGFRGDPVNEVSTSLLHVELEVYKARYYEPGTFGPEGNPSYTTLLLPLAYGDHQQVEALRQELSVGLAQRRSDSVAVWDDIREAVADALDIEPGVFAAKPHLASWLRGQGCHSEEDVPRFNQRRREELRLPGLAEFRAVYDAKKA